ncbi:MAG: ImmA/IrrE family metallo-endopeptidase [Candidatus Competibacteraceae bacterium]|nr:ImmA/IrrE family metallo-endopeptidase [Candidatus Competibacteraceae bacterium]
MVRYVNDKTGRFTQRPHYEPTELDRECERIIVRFLESLYGKAQFPVSTEDLKKLIERDAEDLDCYADLSRYGPDVEGLTEFQCGQKPLVQISSELTENDRRENRLRTTLTHEYGHVYFHAYLFETMHSQNQLFQTNRSERVVCKRDSIVSAPETNWMEWQAGYVCGALLMPISYVKKITTDFLTESNHYGPIASASSNGIELITRVVDAFKVSEDAARVRLLKLGHLGNERGKSLFS